MGHERGYRPVYAHEQARARRWSGARLERDDELRACVLERLSWGWSPEQIAVHLAEAAGRTVISYESIYRFIYAQAARHKNHAWRRYLPRAKWKRGRRRRKGSSSASFIAHRRPGGGAAAAAGGSNPLASNPGVRTRPRCAPARLSVSRKGALRRLPRRFRLLASPVGSWRLREGAAFPVSQLPGLVSLVRRRGRSPSHHLAYAGLGPAPAAFVLYGHLGSVTGLVKASVSVATRSGHPLSGRPYGRGFFEGAWWLWGWGGVEGASRLTARPSLSLSQGERGLRGASLGGGLSECRRTPVGFAKVGGREVWGAPSLSLSRGREV